MADQRSALRGYARGDVLVLAFSQPISANPHAALPIPDVCRQPSAFSGAVQEIVAPPLAEPEIVIHSPSMTGGGRTKPCANPRRHVDAEHRPALMNLALKRAPIARTRTSRPPRTVHAHVVGVSTPAEGQRSPQGVLRIHLPAADGNHGQQSCDDGFG